MQEVSHFWFIYLFIVFAFRFWKRDQEGVVIFKSEKFTLILKQRLFRKNTEKKLLIALWIKEIFTIFYLSGLFKHSLIFNFKS